MSDRAKLGIAGVLAVFVAAFLGALLALAIDGNGNGDRGHGEPFGLAAAQVGGPPSGIPGLPGQAQGGVPQAPGSSGGQYPGVPGGMPVPPGGDSQGFPGQAAPPALPAIPNQQDQGSGQSNNNSGQGNSN